MLLSRRQFCAKTARFGAAAAVAVTPLAAGRVLANAQAQNFSLNYVLGSPMYGTAPLADVLGEVHKIGADAIDIWPRVHANHREQMDELGHDRVAELLDKHGVKLGMITRYDLGPYRLQEEFPILKQFGGKLVVCGARRQPGDTEKERVRKFVESMKGHVARAAEHDITIGIENHASTPLHSPDSIRYFGDFIADMPRFGLAMAPYHLPQDPAVIAGLIEHLGDKLVFFQAWQHGMGCKEKLPKEQELLQMPGRGSLDFKPILAALKRIQYRGWTEIFMHPVPRGIPILDSTAQVTQEINRSRSYLERCLSELLAGDQ